MASLYMKFAGGLTALALCASPTGAALTMTSKSGISAFVALSALGSDASRTALCGSAASVPVSAGGVASAQALPGTSCVLPVADRAPVPVVKTSSSVAEPVYAAPSVAKKLPNSLLIGFPAVLVALGLIAMLSKSDQYDDRVPIGPF